MEDSIMDTLNGRDDTQFYNDIASQREIIRQSLDEIASDIGMALRDVGITFPVFITARNSGDSLATIATPLDPSDHDWERATAIVCQIIGKKRFFAVWCGLKRPQEGELRSSFPAMR
jgi:hypothetical protein